MTKIQTTYKNLKSIIEKIKLQGKDESKTTKPLIYNAILSCKDNKVTCTVMNYSCTVIGSFEFNTIEILEEGNICIGDLMEFSEFLSKFNGEENIILETTENKLIIKKEKKRKRAILNLVSEVHIEDTKRAENAIKNLSIEDSKAVFNETKIEKKYVIKIKDFKEILDDGNISTFTRVFYINFTPEKINCRIGMQNENNIETEVPLISGLGECKTTFRAGIDNVFSNILDSDTATIYIDNETPMIVSTENKEYKATFVIAPSEE